MKRGDLVTIVLPGVYGKLRPALVIQSDLFDEHPLITILPLTSELRDTPLFRISVKPDQGNGLRLHSQVMIDKAPTLSIAPGSLITRPPGTFEETSRLI